MVLSDNRRLPYWRNGMFGRVPPASVTGIAGTLTALTASVSGTTLTVTATSTTSLVGGKFGFYISLGEGVAADADTGFWMDGDGAASSQSLAVTFAEIEALTGAIPASNAVLNIATGYSLESPATEESIVLSGTVTPVVYTVTVDDTTPTQGQTLTAAFVMVVGPSGQSITHQWQINDVSEGELQLASALNYGPTHVQLTADVTTPATTTDYLVRYPFIIGSANMAELYLSFFNFYNTHNSSDGILGIANSFSIQECAIEYNSTFKPVYFSGVRTKTINASASDVQSDAVSASEFGVGSFTRDSQGWIRLRLRFTTPATDVYPGGPDYAGTGVFSQLYDKDVVSVVNGVDSTGAMSTTGGTSSNKSTVGRLYVPIVLGKPIGGAAKSFVLIGDSKVYGIGDTHTAVGAEGITRAMFSNAVTGADAFACLNLGSPSGRAGDWAAGTPALQTTYLQYAKYALENYGTNTVSLIASTDLHAVLRTNGIEHIIRTSLTPNTSSTDDWATEGNQTAVAGWSNGGTVDIFQDALAALVDTDYTYFDNEAVRGVDPWKWVVTGAANYATDEGLHENAVGYELTVRGTGSIIADSGTTAGTLRSVIEGLA